MLVPTKLSNLATDVFIECKAFDLTTVCVILQAPLKEAFCFSRETLVDSKDTCQVQNVSLENYLRSLK